MISLAVEELNKEVKIHFPDRCEVKLSIVKVGQGERLSVEVFEMDKDNPVATRSINFYAKDYK